MSILCFGMHVLCVYAVKLLSGCFCDTVWLFLVKTGWQPCWRSHLRIFELLLKHGFDNGNCNQW